MFIFILISILSLLLLHAAFFVPPEAVITIMLFIGVILIWVEPWGEILCIQS